MLLKHAHHNRTRRTATLDCGPGVPIRSGWRQTCERRLPPPRLIPMKAHQYRRRRAYPASHRWRELRKFKRTHTHKAETRTARRIRARERERWKREREEERWKSERTECLGSPLPRKRLFLLRSARLRPSLALSSFDSFLGLFSQGRRHKGTTRKRAATKGNQSTRSLRASHANPWCIFAARLTVNWEPFDCIF